MNISEDSKSQSNSSTLTGASVCQSILSISFTASIKPPNRPCSPNSHNIGAMMRAQMA